MVLREDQKTRLIGDQVQPVVVVAKIPANPAIARATLQGRGREAQQCQSLRLVGGDIPQRVTDLWQRPQIVMCLHQRLEAVLFGRGDWAHDQV